MKLIERGWQLTVQVSFKASLNRITICRDTQIGRLNIGDVMDYWAVIGMKEVGMNINAYIFKNVSTRERKVNQG